MKQIKTGIVILAASVTMLSCKNRVDNTTSNSSFSSPPSLADTVRALPAPDHTNVASETIIPATTNDPGQVKTEATPTLPNASQSMALAGHKKRVKVLYVVKKRDYGVYTGMSAKDRTPVARTGQYNSDINTPPPPNLDDRYLRAHPPAHSYGDTSPHMDGLNSTR